MEVWLGHGSDGDASGSSSGAVGSRIRGRAISSLESFFCFGVATAFGEDGERANQQADPLGGEEAHGEGI